MDLERIGRDQLHRRADPEGPFGPKELSGRVIQVKEEEKLPLREARREEEPSPGLSRRGSEHGSMRTS
jgi:hypothetical protein